MTTTNAADDPSAHSVAILLLRDRARMRRVRRLRPDRRLDLAAVLGLVGSSSSQKVVLRSQNESSIRIPPIAVSPSDIDRTKRRAPRSRDQRLMGRPRRDAVARNDPAAQVIANETGLTKNTRIVGLALPVQFVTSR